LPRSKLAIEGSALAHRGHMATEAQTQKPSHRQFAAFRSTEKDMKGASKHEPRAPVKLSTLLFVSQADARARPQAGYGMPPRAYGAARRSAHAREP
jgi:hypothetical protein